MPKRKVHEYRSESIAISYDRPRCIHAAAGCRCGTSRARPSCDGTHRSRPGCRRAPAAALTLLGVVLAGCAASGAPPPAPSAAPAASLILVSLDGFRWDYLERFEPPNLRRLAGAGVRAEGLVPVFPSKTFPCHYSLVTGLYPRRHGILSNDMYDPELDAEFHLGDRAAVEDPRWWGGEPLWVTAERQGVRSAAMFWPGTEVEIDGWRPSHWHRFDMGFRFQARVEQVLAWLDLPVEQRPRFVTLYFEEPNESGHRYGPESEATRRAVLEVDALLGQLLAGIEARGLADAVDVVVVSDHGMAAVSRERTVILDEYVDLLPGELLGDGAVVQIWPREGRSESIYAALHGAHPSLAVYRREDVPERYHLGDSPRVPPILGVADVGWLALSREGAAATRLLGDHGQDPAAEDLHGLFVAAGPSFRHGVEIGRFESVELYNLLAEVLGIEPAPNDGTPGLLSDLLRR